MISQPVSQQWPALPLTCLITTSLPPFLPRPHRNRIFVRPYGDLPDAAEATAALADNATDETGWGDGLSFEVFVNLDYDPYLRGHGNETGARL